jgi:hypothetical protein
MAISVAKEEPNVAPAQPLYDTLGRTTESTANEDTSAMR